MSGCSATATAILACRTTGQLGGAGAYAVASASEPGMTWIVDITAPGVRFCGCPAFAIKHACRHAVAADEALSKERAHLDEARRDDPQYRARLIERSREIERMFE